jgi:hypothetical protein
MPPTGGVFVSWGSPDAMQVRPIVERLKRLGISVWEYSEDMPAGARIQEQVMDVINDVRVAVVCFSGLRPKSPGRSRRSATATSRYSTSSRSGSDRIRTI